MRAQWEGLIVNRTPVVLIHGAWFHRTCWERWTGRFTAHGYSVSTPGWPGEAATAALARHDPGPLRDLGLAALTDHYAEVVRSFDIPPVLIGHSAGGLIAQQLLNADLGQAAVALAPAPVEGTPQSGLRPRLWAPGVVVVEDEDRGSVALTRDRFRRSVGNAVGEEEADALFEKYAVPAPRRLLADLGIEAGAAPTGGLDGARVADKRGIARGPLLLVSGQEDRLVEDAATRAVYKLYGDLVAVTELKQFADRGHSLVFDSGWRTVADHVLAWLADNGAGAGAHG
jgi:alpha-beta hydrolase superfamily lysophospholipase